MAGKKRKKKAKKRKFNKRTHKARGKLKKGYKYLRGGRVVKVKS